MGHTGIVDSPLFVIRLSTCFVKLWAQATGPIPDVRVFRWPGSVFGTGVRSPALIQSRVPGAGYPIPGTRYQAECPSHASKNPHMGSASCIHFKTCHPVPSSLRHPV